MAIDPASEELLPTFGDAQEFTPTGTQSVSALARRRIKFALLVIATIAALALWLVTILARDGFSLLDALLLVAFLLNAPWVVIGFWNAVIGFLVLHATRDPIATVIPLAARARADDPVVERTAIFMTVRNEDTTRAFARLKAIKASLDATGYGAQFDYFVLSDSSRHKVIAAEERAIATWRKESGDPRQLFYRHRDHNTGFKAGNVRDFCERWGKNYEFMLPLDADSLITGATVLRLVRIMQANPRLGILQSLVVGMPSTSFFARTFQFGMRHSMRSYTAGSSWWHADCGPFWGHNAILRIKPFTDHCRLPDLPGEPPLGGHILSHDQVEAVLMRRAGYEVRVLPEEGGSYEENPPALPDFLHRDVRWCQGNMQYLKLMDLPGLFPTSWAQLALAIQMFIGSAGLVLLVPLAAIAAALWKPGVPFPTGWALGLYLVWILMFLTPKLTGVLDAALRSGARYGGLGNLALSSVVETVFIFLLVPIEWFTQTMTMFALLFGRTAEWDAPNRDGYRVSWRSAVQGLWPHTLFGGAILLFLAATAPGALPWFLTFLAGLVLAIPFAVVTSWPSLGRFAARHRICAIPEEIEPLPEIAAIAPRRAARA
jgi:membrane glycosyltransferase